MGEFRLGVVSSHGGTNLQAILDACRSGSLPARVAVVVSNNSASTALQRARDAGIPWHHISRVTHPDDADRDRAFLAAFQDAGVELVVLAGYNLLLGRATLAAFANRVINTHPAPLPRFGGQGMYGRAVHEAVLASGVTESGPTVHLADDRYDHGCVIAHRPVPVADLDTPERLQQRVMEAEHALLVETIAGIARGEIDLDAIARLAT